MTAIENRVISGLQAAQAKLIRAREANDINAEVEAQRTISQLAVEETRLAALKERQSQAKERTVQTPSLDQTLQNTPKIIPQNNLQIPSKIPPKTYPKKFFRRFAPEIPPEFLSHPRFGHHFTPKSLYMA